MTAWLPTLKSAMDNPHIKWPYSIMTPVNLILWWTENLETEPLELDPTGLDSYSAEEVLHIFSQPYNLHI